MKIVLHLILATYTLLLIQACGGGGGGSGVSSGTIQGRVMAAGISFKSDAARLDIAVQSAVPGATCTIEGTDKSVATDDAGHFLFTAVTPGSYIIICKKAAADGKLFAFLRVVDVQAGATVDLGELEITSTGAIKGKVTLDGRSDHTGIGIFIPGTSLEARTDGNGAYVLEGVPAGSYEVHFEKSGYGAIKLTDISVAAAQTTSTPDLVLNISTGATGSITIENGRAYFNSRTVTVSIKASNDATLMQISEDPLFINIGWEPIAATHQWTFSSDGGHTLYAKFANANGLQSSPVADSIIIDTQPPDVTVFPSGATATEAFIFVMVLSTGSSSTRVDLGLTQDYGLQLTDVNFHFTGLSPKTLYHYKVTVTNAAGNTTTSPDLTFTTLPQFKAVATGAYNTCAISEDGEVLCWGAITQGLSKALNIPSSTFPVTIPDIANPLSLAVGNHICALLHDHTILCWGDNSFGQLGHGATEPFSLPLGVSNISNASAVAVGLEHTCALLSDTTVKCWGDNTYGQLGDGTNTASSSPVSVTGLSNVIAITAASEDTTCALISDGTIKCWGYGLTGELGDGNKISSPIPVTVNGISTAKMIASGVTSFSDASFIPKATDGPGNFCALLSDGTVMCWGAGFSTMPSAIGGISGATSLVGGGDSYCTSAGSIKTCFTFNGNNYLGVPVLGVLGDAAQLSFGYIHQCGLFANGSIQCQGRNKTAYNGFVCQSGLRHGTCGAGTLPTPMYLMRWFWTCTTYCVTG